MVMARVPVIHDAVKLAVAQIQAIGKLTTEVEG
jgi:hypothetical protein